MRGERMAHGVAGGALGDGGLADGGLELALQRDFMEVVAGDATGARMRAERGCGKDVLPYPLSRGIRPFAQQGFGDVDITRADS